MRVKDIVKCEDTMRKLAQDHIGEYHVLHFAETYLTPSGEAFKLSMEFTCQGRDYSIVAAFDILGRLAWHTVNSF